MNLKVKAVVNQIKAIHHLHVKKGSEKTTYEQVVKNLNHLFRQALEEELTIEEMRMLITAAIEFNMKSVELNFSQYVEVAEKATQVA